MKLKYKNIGPVVGKHSHGIHSKNLIVLHETVSPDLDGFKDIDGVAKYLADKDYGIHGLTDAEGLTAWATGYGKAIFYHAGGVNTQSIGIEQVSKVMLQSPLNSARALIWALRKPQLRATAKLLAAISNTWGIPLVYTNGESPGVTSHWDVSQHHKESDGHTDCWPRHKGGYYPILTVLNMAKVYAKTGVTL